MEPTFVPQPIAAKPRAPHRLVGDALRRPGGRRALSVLSIVLALAGVGMFAYPFYTDLYQARVQHRLRTQFDSPAYAEAYRLRLIKVGEGLTQLRIPKIGVSVLVVEGTTPSALRAGAGHYVGTPLPGQAGNVGIAGHRTTFGRPFNQLDKLAPGDIAYLDTPFNTFTYRAVQSWSGAGNPHPVSPEDFTVVSAPPAGTNAHWLTLTTCHPKGSARQRLVLRLELIKTEARPQATPKK